ncbi:MAG TPA: type II toxin-antitoxin system RelE/ParE family toxin [Verrucomicrobiaceae bacterium]|jgi:hypothetical protein
MKLLILPEALVELESAMRYYRAIAPDLGGNLRSEFEARVRWAMENPSMLRLRDGGYRRVNLARFPYYIPYIVREDTMWILAFAHALRAPEYWMGRGDANT